jgi:hypothetical protein
MSDSTEGCLGITVIIAHIAAWVLTGIAAWNWIEPESFGGAIKFLIVWAVFGFIARLIIVGIAAVIAKGMD